MPTFPFAGRGHAVRSEALELHELKEIDEARQGEDIAQIMVHVFDIDVASYGLTFVLIFLPLRQNNPS